MPAEDFRKFVTQSPTEILIGGKNLSRKVEFYDGLGFGKRGENRESIGTTIKNTQARFSDKTGSFYPKLFTHIIISVLIDI